MATNTKSAICFIPPIEYLSYIQSIRKDNDKAYDRWMPHMNLFFPFLESDKIEDGVKELEKVLKGVSSFPISFEHFDAFKRKKDATIHMVPTDNGEMKLVHELISKTLNIESTKEFHPHLTVAQCKKGVLPDWIEKLTTEFEDHTFSYLCDAVYVIERGDDTPFEVKHVLKFGN
jgi:RNA 2',3'-cyclic 3'-phosphodiesterase